MAINFPNSPNEGDIHQVADRVWQWDGEKWKATGTTSSSAVGAVVVFEGATADAYETTLTVVDPTADRTITLPNTTGTVALTSDLTIYAPLASPTLTGVPAAPTASANTSTTQVATTAFVMTEVGDYAPLASPTLTGVPAAPTASANTNTTQVATTAFVVTEVGAVTTTALTGSTNTWIPTITAANALTGTANFTYDGNTLDVKNSGTASSIKLYCETSNAHYQAIKAAPHSGSSNWTLTLPSTVPSVSGQALTATTAGVASWAAIPAADDASTIIAGQIF